MIMLQITSFWGNWALKFAHYLPKFVLAIATLLFGFWLIKKTTKFLSKYFSKSGMDASLSKFLSSSLSTFFKILLLLSVAKMFGVETTSFVAILGGLSIGIGMALNGTIGHFASGVLLMIFKPFKVGDLVEIGGSHKGVVQAITAFNTELKTLDNKKIIVANSLVTGNTITNISGQETIGVEMSFGIAYSADIDLARKAILEVGAKCSHILENPEHVVVVSALGDSAVTLSTRPFCKSEHYWDTFFFMQENVKKEFDKLGIEIPFPQLQIHKN